MCLSSYSHLFGILSESSPVSVFCGKAGNWCAEVSKWLSQSNLKVEGNERNICLSNNQYKIDLTKCIVLLKNNNKKQSYCNI